MSTIKIIPESDNIINDSSPNMTGKGKIIRIILMAYVLITFTILLSSCLVEGRGWGWHHHGHDRGHIVDEHRGYDDHR